MRDVWVSHCAALRKQQSLADSPWLSALSPSSCRAGPLAHETVRAARTSGRPNTRVQTCERLGVSCVCRLLRAGLRRLLRQPVSAAAVQRKEVAAERRPCSAADERVQG